MKPEKVFKRYDVRGRYPEELDEEFVGMMGESLAAFAKENYNNKVVVCRDTKKSSMQLKECLIEGLRSQGIDVLDIGIGPTDMAAFQGQKNNCISVQVTSSHMPLDFNGLKFMYPEGNGFVNEDLNKLEELFHKKGKGKKEEGSYMEIESARDEYSEALENFVKEKIGVPDDRRIVVETMGGAGSHVLPEVLENLGFDVETVSGEKLPYRNPPNPKPENLKDLERKVEENDAYIGLALDLDADRVTAYFEGEWISGDDLFCIFAQLFQGDVVASVDTDTKLEEFAENIYYTRVGDPFVIDETIEKNAVLSGEPNGHYCFPEFTNYNSGTLAGLILACSNLEELMANIPESHIAQDNFEFGDNSDAEEAMEKFKECVEDKFEVLSTVDGVKFDLYGSTVLARLSGSSPVIRVKCFDEMEKRAEDALSNVREIFGKDINH
ncbi:hypothetical protein [Candidatus Nanohalobium constans]|uniref:Phosphomannomutase / phosphoglucomutase n=1 Tax=Candidatus Nanohalobium constans TaxID=2565781 RepID=A0A5Q0UJM2_9ARCH|nr:hypothetical protein [Candidatus Nanohalobium constans]QGA81019.1 phosphomannomutase / phosphoglucomutase [Candidatus Nanohalobium constans]